MEIPTENADDTSITVEAGSEGRRIAGPYRPHTAQMGYPQQRFLNMDAQ